jgi:hypothetical protein
MVNLKKSFTLYAMIGSIVLCFTLSGCQYLKWPKTEQLPTTYRSSAIDEELSSFSKIVISGPIDIDMHFVAGKSYLSLEGDANLLEQTPYYVKDDTLYLISNPQYKYPPENKLMLTLYSGMLTHVEYHGSGKINLPNIQTPYFSLNIAGGAFVYMTGKTYRLDLTLSGTSRVNAKCVKARVIFVNTSDLAQAEVANNGNVSALSSGQSDVYYYNRPQMIAGHTRTSGSIMRMEGILSPYSVPYQIPFGTTVEQHPIETMMVPKQG